MPYRPLNRLDRGILNCNRSGLAFFVFFCFLFFLFFFCFCFCCFVVVVFCFVFFFVVVVVVFSSILFSSTRARPVLIKKKKIDLFSPLGKQMHIFIFFLSGKLYIVRKVSSAQTVLV